MSNRLGSADGVSSTHMQLMSYEHMRHNNSLLCSFEPYKSRHVDIVKNIQGLICCSTGFTHLPDSRPGYDAKVLSECVYPPPPLSASLLLSIQQRDYLP